MTAERKPFQDEKVIGFTPSCPVLGSSDSLQWISHTPYLLISTTNTTAWSLLPERLAPFWVQSSRSHVQGTRQAPVWSALSSHNSKNMKTGGIVSFPQHKRGDWPTQVQGQCQILPESEFSQGSTPHVMKWEEKISTSKTKFMESLRKDWRDVCLCVLGWVGGPIWWAEVQFCTFFLFIVTNKQTLAVYTIQAQLHLCRLFKAKLKILLITV